MVRQELRTVGRLPGSDGLGSKWIGLGCRKLDRVGLDGFQTGSGWDQCSTFLHSFFICCLFKCHSVSQWDALYLHILEVQIKAKVCLLLVRSIHCNISRVQKFELKEEAIFASISKLAISTHRLPVLCQQPALMPLYERLFFFVFFM